jgi:hypothetical protein
MDLQQFTLDTKDPFGKNIRLNSAHHVPEKEFAVINQKYIFKV